ncbi:Uncharacterised protein [Mycobacteroides abscessus subsp. abscessus]|nr:Uncharacterised protein [Mycobacteroides abscessus subsp. abscessus]
MRSASAISATSEAPTAPSSTSGAMASARRSKTVRPPGQSTSRRAMGAPILPRPMYPSLRAGCVMTG